MLGYDDQGYQPDGFINFLALLGWTPTNDQEILSMDEMINDFDMGRISKGGCRFDLDKLNWFNSQYVNKLPISEVFDVDTLDRFDDETLECISTLAKARAVLHSDMSPIIDIFIKDVQSYSKINQLTDEFKDSFTTFINNIDSTGITFKDGQEIKDYIYKVAVKDGGHKFGKVMPGLRQALTGGIPGPDLMTTMVILGKKESINRIKKALI